MDTISMKKQSLEDYKAIILDMDGTLYFQKPFRRKMICSLFMHLLKNPTAIKDMLIIWKYRVIREDWTQYEDTMHFDANADMKTRQYYYVASKMRTTSKYVEQVIDFYMMKMPLSLLDAYKDQILIHIIEYLKEKSCQIIVYSDYPVEDKMKALGVCADKYYTSADPLINCMKPNPKGLEVIMRDLGIDASEAIMIGDRYEKDGLAAIANGMDYIILDSDCKKRAVQEKYFLKN